MNCTKGPQASYSFLAAFNASQQAFVWFDVSAFTDAQLLACMVAAIDANNGGIISTYVPITIPPLPNPPINLSVTLT